MNHVNDGALLAFLDGELGRSDRAATERHLAECRECSAMFEELREASARLETLLMASDRPAPIDRAAHAFRRRRAATRLVSTRRALLRAAVLVLGFAAVASAALPNSPVRAWAVAAWRQGVALVGGETAEPMEPSASVAAEAGVSVQPANGRVRIIVESPAEGVRAQVRLVEGRQVFVRASGAAAAARFRTSPGRLDIVEPGSGELRIDIPLTMRGADLIVDGLVLVSKVGASLQVSGDDGAGDGTTEVDVMLAGPAAER